MALSPSFCFAHSHLAVGCPNSCRDKGVECSVKAKLPLKQRFFQGHTSSEGLRDIFQTVFQVLLMASKYFSDNEDFKTITLSCGLRSFSSQNPYENIAGCMSQ